MNPSDPRHPMHQLWIANRAARVAATAPSPGATRSAPATPADVAAIIAAVPGADPGAKAGRSDPMVLDVAPFGDRWLVHLCRLDAWGNPVAGDLVDVPTDASLPIRHADQWKRTA